MARTDSGSPLRVALVGYGLAGSVFHAPLIAATDGLVLDTIVTTSPERRQQARAEFPDVRFADSVDDLFARADELDLAVIASPNRTHVTHATAALRAGLNVVVDKPLAATAAEARELAAFAEQRGLLLSVFQNRRWDGDFRTVQSLIADGALGDVWRFESRFERWRPEPKGGWRESGDPEDIGGLLYDLGSHLVDQALVLFGPVARVYAESQARRPWAEADDDTFIALTHVNGVRSQLFASSTTAQLGPRFRVLGSRAGYVKFGLDPQEDALRAGRRPAAAGLAAASDTSSDTSSDATSDATSDLPGWGTEPESQWGYVGSPGSLLTDPGRPYPTLPGAYPEYYALLAAALRTGAPNPVPPLEAAAALEVLQAARRSAETNTVVELPTRE
ncbi:Gfo/Idh/MocA family protein [Streptomyces odontomachi]|uniref:Gfo/Idh/MocA family protein n=1 Tax=Streptomyces odontomachi TaxID=2944940 RepID=UPI00210A154B|nr:Gfo/Idh/MocA family oxidoreductase [Streptomyces sp. ODS25]